MFTTTFTVEMRLCTLLSIVLLISSGCVTSGLGNKQHDRQISWKKKVNPVWWVGNIDEPVPPEDYKPNDAHRSFRYNVRNPFHNFDFYVIGVADRNCVRLGRYPADVFNPYDGWNWAASRYKCIWLPFISYKHNDFKFYIGWRERGNFGLKLNF